MSSLKLELGMKLTQNLVMTPQLQMAIKLLQLTKMELAELVTKELEENPTLEESDFEGEDYEELSKEDKEKVEKLINDTEATPELSATNTEEKLAADLEKQVSEIETDKSEIDWDTYFESYMDGPSDITPRDTGGDDRPTADQFLAKESTLTDKLSWQLKFSSTGDDDLIVGEEIIGNINDDGYFVDVSLEDIAETTGKDIKLVEKIHQRIMRFDPLGIAARDLRECLLVQVKFGKKGTPLVAKIIKDRWKLVEKRNIVKLARALKSTKAEIEEAMRIIVTLDPKPGAEYNIERTEYVTPDIYIYKVADKYHIQLNDDGMPRLRVNNYYQKLLTKSSNSSETKGFIKNKLRSATWLIRSIHQRQRTIYKVTESIVQQQKEFLDKGVEFLKPMVLRNVAEDISMHECTVSRVTTNKYVHTPRGLFELKYFFNSGITNSEGEGISSETIKTKIRLLIEKEDQKKPLSDQKLVTLLKEGGIDVARRTVAKYREMLGILSSSGRRKTF